MKFEWRKHEKALYGAKSIPALVDIHTQKFIMIKGSGNPNDTDFSDKVGALFSLVYAIKMGYKSTATKNILSNEIHDFTVYPLEGIWKQKNVDTESAAGKLIKENLEYAIMIRQPDFITAEMVCAALERVKIKKPNRLYEDIIFDTIHDGKCVEILHIGSYDNEPFSFEHIRRISQITLRTIPRYNLRSDNHTHQRRACCSPVIFAGEKEGNHLPLLFRELHTAGNRGFIRAL